MGQMFKDIMHCPSTHDITSLPFWIMDHTLNRTKVELSKIIH